MILFFVSCAETGGEGAARRGRKGENEAKRSVARFGFSTGAASSGLGRLAAEGRRTRVGGDAFSLSLSRRGGAVVCGSAAAATRVVDVGKANLGVASAGFRGPVGGAERRGERAGGLEGIWAGTDFGEQGGEVHAAFCCTLSFRGWMSVLCCWCAFLLHEDSGATIGSEQFASPIGNGELIELLLSGDE